MLEGGRPPDRGQMKHGSNCSCGPCWKQQNARKKLVTEARAAGRPFAHLMKGPLPQAGKAKAPAPRPAAAAAGGGSERDEESAEEGGEEESSFATVGEVLWPIKSLQDVAKLTRLVEVHKDPRGL